MDESTSISSSGVEIANKDESVGGLWFKSNKKIFNLPENVNKKFPNLIGYDAEKCSLSAITKSNFVGLKSLRSLDLEDNQIRKISFDTFEDLYSLERLDLSNLITFLQFRLTLMLFFRL